MGHGIAGALAERFFHGIKGSTFPSHMMLRYYSGSVGISPGGNLNALAYSRQAYFGPDYASQTVSPETRFLTDVAAGTLADVTYVVPEGENSDAAQDGLSTGPQWVASVVNAVGTSAFYNDTAIFVTWLGFRIPLIAISPYAKHGKLIDTIYEPGSILKFVEDTFGLPSLGTADARATSVADMFDFSQTPPPFKTIASTLSPSYFVTRPIDTSVVDPQ